MQANPIYPAAKSPARLAAHYVFSAINRKALREAQVMFDKAKSMGVCREAERMVNNANYLLTDAYKGGTENDEFWRQFNERI